jgi:hypothetical protein
VSRVNHSPLIASKPPVAAPDAILFHGSSLWRMAANVQSHDANKNPLHQIYIYMSQQFCKNEYKQLQLETQHEKNRCFIFNYFLKLFFACGWVYHVANEPPVTGALAFTASTA